MKQQTLIVIGGGAAGFFCAVNAAAMQPELKVMVVEKTGKVLSKVKVSGGGRCNVTHACFNIDEMIRNYPRGAMFLKKSFHWFFTPHTVNWYEQRGISLTTETDGRMFPATNSSQTIIDCLLRDAGKYGVELRLNREVKQLERKHNRWQATFTNGEKLPADYVCVACGGYPKTAMFGWLQALGHHIEIPVPSLFSFNIPGNSLTGLMGLSVEKAIVKVAGAKLEAEGPVLVTHWGLSGPAILRLSAWGARELHARDYQFTLLINWLPGTSEPALQKEFQAMGREQGTQRIAQKNAFGLPQRLWEWLTEASGIGATTRWAELDSGRRNRLVASLLRQELPVKGKTTFKEEFVTAGGIRLNEVDPGTMMSRIQPGLFFAGEILDVDGITGGFNFQHAWTSGWIAASSIAMQCGSQVAGN